METGNLGARPCFRYGERETAYLAGRDAALGKVIGKVGHILREVDPDIFRALVRNIVGQQVSSKALATVWGRLEGRVGSVSPGGILGLGARGLCELGMSMRKAGNIVDLARKVDSGELDLQGIRALDDGEATRRLSSLKGVGEWTAQMVLLFSLERPDILSRGDLGIRRGLCLLHHHDRMDKALFSRYRELYSPFCSVASLYLWEVAGGRVEPG